MAATAKNILQLENKFWEAMTSGNFNSLFELMTDSVVISTSQGNLTLDHAGFKKISESWPIQIHSFALSNESVVFPQQNVAVASYDVAQDATINGKRQKLTCHDTTTWVRNDDKWLCCAHTEIPAAQP